MPRRALLTLCALCAATTLAACGPGPKPPQIIELERLRNSAEFSAIQQAAPAPIQRHDEMFKRAIDAWQDSRDADARGFAELADVYYQAASFRAQIKRENKRRDDASAQVDDLSKQVAQTKSTLDAAEARLSQIQQGQDAQFANAAKGREAQQLLVTCEAAKASADALNAAANAPATYARAENSLRIAREQLQLQRNDEALRLINEAIEQFNAAANEAQPFADLAKIFEDAQREMVGDVFREGRAVIISVPRLFDSKDATIDHERAFMLDRIAKLALKYPRSNLIIEGHTSAKGSASKMRELSEARATIVQAHLIRQGVPANRILTAATGSDRPRYDTKDRDERAKNDRVEIAFTPGK
jgi:outer membrane protein OmpA-like peptidoglycan-associated protein